MEVDIFPQPEPAGDLRLPALRRHGPGTDGRASHQLLRVPLPLHQRHPPRRVAERPGHGPDEAVLPSRHRHGPGDGRDDRLRQPLAGVHAAGHRLAVRHAVRHGQRAGRLPRALQRNASRSARFRTRRCSSVRPMFADLAGRLRAAAVRRQRADHRRPRRPAPAAVLRHVARRGRHGAGDAATRSARRATFRSATSIPIVPINSVVRRRQRAGDDPDPHGHGPPVYIRDVATIEDASRRRRPATPSPTAGGPSTSWRRSGPTPRR